MWDFIRGIFDGDGCVYTSNTKDKRTNRNYSYKYISITTASYLFANGLNNYLINNGIRSRILSDSRDRTTYYVKIFRQKDVAIFAKNIYSKETVWKLDRKYNKLLSFLE